jgi:hypothetical protein
MPKEVVGVRTGINSSVTQAGGALGGALTTSLLVIFGLADYQLRLLAAGVERARLDSALTALNTILNPATPDPDLDPAVRDQLIAGYQLTYLAAYERVLLLVAAICLLGAVVVWWGLPHNARAAQLRNEA